MQYRPYGTNGPLVSALGFGVMRLPPRRSDDWGSVCWAKAIPVMHAALRAGVNFFDTHHGYHEGLSEEAIGRMLRGWRGPAPIIQTKTPFYRDKPIDHFKRLLEQALRKTGVPRIDYLLFHSMSMDMFKRRGRHFLRFTDLAIRHGLIGARGFSSHDTPANVKAFIDTGEFAAMVLSYNWLNTQMADTLAYGADAGLGVAVMNPVQGGHLAARSPAIMRLLPGAKTPSEIALRFVLSTPGVAVAMSGMSTIRQVAQNVAVASERVPLSPARRRAMLSRIERVRVKQFVCSACGYCMPCPHGVDIPANLLHLSRADIFGLRAYAKIHFSRLRKADGGDRSAFACKRCGACEPKCPNRVKIMAELQRTAGLLAGD